MEQSFILLNLVFVWLGLILTVCLSLNARKSLKATDASNSEFAHLQAGAIAPSFQTWTLDGKQIALGDFANRGLVLWFFSAKCEPCLAKMPQVMKLYEALDQKSVSLILVTTSSVAETVELRNRFSLKTPIFLPGDLLEAYNPSGVLPFFCEISAYHTVERSDVVGGQQWNEFVQSHLNRNT